MQAEEHFARVFQKGLLPEEVLECQAAAKRVGDGLYRLDITNALLEKGLVKSKAEVKRLVAQGAVEVGGSKVTSPIVEMEDGGVLKVGKRGFLRIIIDPGCR